MTNTMMLQLKTAKEIKRMQFDKCLVYQKSAEDILKLKDIVNKYKIPNEYYKNFLFIQLELINNDAFSRLLKDIKDKFQSYNVEVINLILKTISESTINVSINNISSDVIYNIIENAYEFSSYLNASTLLSNFIYVCNNKNFNDSTKNVIVSNLKYFLQSNGKISIEDFNDEEIEQFVISNIELCNPKKEDIKEFCKYKSKNTNIEEICKLLTEKKVKVILLPEEIKLFSNNTNAANNIKYVISKLDSANYIERFFLYWQSNNFSDKELTTFSNLCRINNKETLYSILSNKISFIASIYKDKYTIFSNLTDLTNARQDLYIYAITNNKKAFLKLIKENIELFKSVPTHSLLFLKDFRNHLNINTLNVKDIERLKLINQTKVNKYLWLDNMNYVFNEIEELATAKTVYIKFYKMLNISRTDEKLIILKEVKNKNLLDDYYIDKIKTIAEKLSEKSIYLWMREDFKHITGLRTKIAVKLLSMYDKMSGFIKQIRNNDEAEFLIRNANNEIFNSSVGMEYLRNNIIEFDSDWKTLSGILNLTEDFIKENKENIYNFCIKGGTNIAYTYYRNLDKTKGYKYLKVIKSEISGKFNKLKYFGDDLSKELNVHISEELKQKWMHNSKHSDSKIEILEKDDFYSTMLLGVKPLRTCISYIDGMYSSCLLSNFDSNKKFLFAYFNGEIVGRAIIRFTKAYYASDKNKAYLDFIDVENISEKYNSKDKEFLAIFLEKAYFKGVNNKQICKIKEMFIKTIQRKTCDMNVKLIVCPLYEDVITKNKDFILQNLSLYISLSKSGSQYLDSLNGNKSIADEGKYFTEKFYIN